MLPSDRFRRQHEELFQLSEEIGRALDAATFPANAREVRRMMARFKGKLLVHSSMENEALYPRLLEHANDAIRAKARDLFEELGGIYSAFGEHHTRWSTVEVVEKDPAGYARETHELFAKLARRMGRENEELYPLADREGEASVPPPRVPS
jgi:iron-sulfur cluster repair protein YtfE (RIC family)